MSDIKVGDLPPIDLYSTAELQAELSRRKEAGVKRPWWLWVIGFWFFAIRAWWRWLTVPGLKKFAYICAGLLLVVAVATPIQQQVALNELRIAARERAASAADSKRILKSTDKTVKAIEKATSPEALAEQAALYDRLVRTIDCNSQLQVQRLADELKKLDIPPEGSISLITEACARLRDTGG